MLTLVAFVDDHVSVLDPPVATVAGDALSVTVGSAATVTVAVAVTEPPALVAVMVYVVVADGETLRVPDALTVPTPWLMLTLVALVLDHVNVDDWPPAIEVGDALNVTVGGATTVTVAVAVTLPTALVAVIV